MPSREVVRFALTGVANTLIGLATIVFAQTVLALGPYLSNALGYGAGLTCSYVLNSRWTFSAGAGSALRLARFATAFALAYGANLAVLHGLLAMGTPWPYAQFAALATYSVLFFVLCRFAVFRPPSVPEPAARQSR